MLSTVSKRGFNCNFLYAYSIYLNVVFFCLRTKTVIVFCFVFSSIVVVTEEGDKRESIFLMHIICTLSKQRDKNESAA